MNNQLLTTSKSHPNNFDIIRFILAASVIYCHSFDICYGYQKFLVTEPFMVWSHQQISIGSAAVDLFFIISGFLIAKSFENSTNTYNYLSKRFLRIYPGFIAAYLLSILIVGFAGKEAPYSWEKYQQYFHYLFKKKELVHLFTLQWPYQRAFFDSSPEPGVNDSLWTIQYEFVCYLLLPLLALIGFIKQKSLLIFAFILAYLLVVLQSGGYIFAYKETSNLFFANPYHYPRFIMYFLSGCCFYLYRNKIKRNNLLVLIAIIALALSFTPLKLIDQVLPIAGAYLIFYIAFHPGIRFNNFAKAGDFSYGVYLYGWPVQELIMRYFKYKAAPNQMFFIALPIAIVMAFLSWHLVEKPFLKLKKKSRLYNPVATVG